MPKTVTASQRQEERRRRKGGGEGEGKGPPTGVQTLCEHTRMHTHISCDSLRVLCPREWAGGGGCVAGEGGEHTHTFFFFHKKSNRSHRGGGGGGRVRWHLHGGRAQSRRQGGEPIGRDRRQVAEVHREGRTHHLQRRLRGRDRSARNLRHRALRLSTHKVGHGARRGRARHRYRAGYPRPHGIYATCQRSEADGPRESCSWKSWALSRFC